MSTAQSTAPTGSDSADTIDYSPWLKGVLLPHAIMIGVQLPLATIQYMNLWKTSEHYQFYPFLFAAVAFLVYSRWPKQEEKFRKSTFGNLLIGVAAVFSVGSALFVNPYFASLSVIFLLGSLAVRINDGEGRGTMFAPWLLLFLSVQLPFDFDVQLITTLQRFSAQSTSALLDLVGYRHDLAGAVLQFPNKSYFVEEACSGVQSFFTLLFCSAFYVVWVRRGVIHSLTLIALAVFWAIVMNTFRILLIPIFDIEFGLDLSKGIPHDILGYAVLIFAFLMVASTDSFLSFLLNPVPLERDHWLMKLWTRVKYIATFQFLRKDLKKRRYLGYEHPPERTKSDVTATLRPSKTVKALLWSAVVLIGLTAGVQMVDAAKLFTSRYTVTFGLDRIIEVTEDDLPAKLEKWQCVDYQLEERTRTSELGQRSDVWLYQPAAQPKYTIHAAIDQPFAGWHDLSVCYKNQGWQIDANDQKTLSVKRADSDEAWDLRYVEMHNDLGESAYLFFSFFDVYGQPVAAPNERNSLSGFFQRVKNRLNPRLRKQLFTGEVYQIQVFVRPRSGLQQLTADELNEIRDNYLKVREILRKKVEAMAEEELS